VRTPVDRIGGVFVTRATVGWAAFESRWGGPGSRIAYINRPNRLRSVSVRVIGLSVIVDYYYHYY